MFKSLLFKTLICNTAIIILSVDYNSYNNVVNYIYSWLFKILTDLSKHPKWTQANIYHCFSRKRSYATNRSVTSLPSEPSLTQFPKCLIKAYVSNLYLISMKHKNVGFELKLDFIHNFQLTPQNSVKGQWYIYYPWGKIHLQLPKTQNNLKNKSTDAYTTHTLFGNKNITNDNDK